MKSLQFANGGQQAKRREAKKRKNTHKTIITNCFDDVSVYFFLYSFCSFMCTMIVFCVLFSSFEIHNVIITRHIAQDGQKYIYTTGNLYNWSVNNILAIPSIDHNALYLCCLLSCFMCVFVFFLFQLLSSFSNRCNNYVSAWCVNSFNEHAFIVT